VKRCLVIAILFLSFGVSSEAATCSYYPFTIATLKAQVSRSLLTKGITHAEIFGEVETQSDKKLTFNPGIKRVLVARADINHGGRFAFLNLVPGLYWVVLAPSEYRFAIRIRPQGVKDVELQVDEENGCAIVDFRFLK
jgi:hypothetical protein